MDNIPSPDLNRDEDNDFQRRIQKPKPPRQTDQLISNFVSPKPIRPDPRRYRQLLRRSILNRKRTESEEELDLLDPDVAWEYEEPEPGPLVSRVSPTKEAPKPQETSEIDAAQIPLLNHYRRKVLQQANQSFLLALIAAAIGLIFYVAAVTFLVLRQPQNISVTSLIGGSLVEVISGINFYLYGRASRQLETFHMYLDKACCFVTANRVCDQLKNEELRDQTRSTLILNFMSITSPDSDATKTELPNS